MRDIPPRMRSGAGKSVSAVSLLKRRVLGGNVSKFARFCTLIRPRLERNVQLSMQILGVMLLA